MSTTQAEPQNVYGRLSIQKRDSLPRESIDNEFAGLIDVEFGEEETVYNEMVWISFYL
jgi:hypothetical protein